MKIYWIDSGREPKNPPNPEYPDGVDVDLRQPHHRDAPFCAFSLPYPAPRCGVYYVECKACGTNAMITTTGRRDDPRHVKMMCHPSDNKVN